MSNPHKGDKAVSYMRDIDVETRITMREISGSEGVREVNGGTKSASRPLSDIKELAYTRLHNRSGPILQH